MTSTCIRGFAERVSHAILSCHGTELLSYGLSVYHHHLNLVFVSHAPCVVNEYHISSPSQTLLPMATSSTCPVTVISPTTNFQSIFNTALKAYERRTKTDILAHPLASQLQACKSADSILAVLQGQVDDLDQARRSDERLTKWLSPTIDVLLAFSATLGEGISLVSST